jgi:hypothetical protein
MITSLASEYEESEALEAETCSAELLSGRTSFGLNPFQPNFTRSLLEFHDWLIADLSDDFVQGE